MSEISVAVKNGLCSFLPLKIMLEIGFYIVLRRRELLSTDYFKYEMPILFYAVRK